MDNMSPHQEGFGLHDNKRRMKTLNYRRQSAPSLVITKALNRSKTLSRDTFVIPVNPESCPLVQSFLASSDRSFLLHGHAQLKTGMQTQDRHLFLFTDILVVAKAKSANFKQKAQVSVCEMWTATCLEEVCEGSTFPERSFVMGWPTSNCVAVFNSSDQKERWLSVLKSRIKEEKEKEEPKTIPLRVYGKGINTFAVTKMLPVSNCDSTNEVIRLALQQFGIIGNVKDFQLWVISKRDDCLYPLIGHEFPFSIQMSHVKHSMSLVGRGDMPSSPADRQRAMQVEQMQVYKQCQFILKPRPTETLRPSEDLSKKPFKRRRSLITWAFWRGSSYNLNELSEADQGRLFSQPLSSICGHNTLPKPIMDMLAFLYHEGSSTRGIFRRPAGARAVRELRDSLDTGPHQLPLTKDNVFIIAGVFKDFLRSIPGSLLCCELHEEWMDVLDEDDDEEEQVQDVRRMISRLPKENTLLLRYLLAMLHGIQSNAQENQMTSFNLSVCIAPSMLWPPGVPCSPEVEGEGTKKVCELVKFMIEHCEDILGVPPSSLFGGPPQRVAAEETGSDSWLYPLTDSSYDSLENDLDNSSGSSPGFFSRDFLKPKQHQGSLDSILTFSDYDQETEADTQHKLRPPERRTDRREETDVFCEIQKAHTLKSTSNLEWMSLDPRHRQRRRRCSEPAISYLSKFRSRAHALTGEDEEGEVEEEEEEEEFFKMPTRHTLSPSGGETSRGESSLYLATSPAPTSSSQDSLSSEHTWATRRLEKQTHPSYASSSVPSPSCTTSTPITSTQPDRGTSQKASSPKDPIHWESMKGSGGLHPNSWLKKSQGLSISQQDNLDKEEEDTDVGGHSESKACEKVVGKPTSSSHTKSKTTYRVLEGGQAGHIQGGAVQEPNKHLQLKQVLPSSPSHHRSTGCCHFPISPRPQASDSQLRIKQVSDEGRGAKHGTQSEGKVPKQPPPCLFYNQSKSSAFPRKESKPHVADEKGKSRLPQRRGSEPARQIVRRASSLPRPRLPSDPGLRVSDVDWRGETSEAQFCLTPYATKTVREYFTSHRHSHPQSSQQVALALAESRREWLKRCNGAKAEPDLEKLLFAEESFV